MSRPHRNRPFLSRTVLRAPLAQHVDLLLCGDAYAARLYLPRADPGAILADLEVLAYGGRGLLDALAGFPAPGEDNPEGEILVWLEDGGVQVRAEFLGGSSTGSSEPSSERYGVWFPVRIAELRAPRLHLAWPARTDQERVVSLDPSGLRDAADRAIVLDKA